MAYTRRRRSTRRRRDSAASGGGRVLIALVLAGAVIYLISASAAGTWVAERVIAPAFAFLDRTLEEAGTTPTPAETPVPAAAPAEQITAEVQMPALTCFALQMGVYESRENAAVQAEELQARGAGGFVMEDAGRYRVLAAAYAEETSLRQVREQLGAEGMESAAYTLRVPERVLNVTAEAEQTAALQAGFTALHTLPQALTEAALRFDQGGQSPAEGRAAAEALQAELLAVSGPLAALDQGEGSGVIAALTACVQDCEAALLELTQFQTQSVVDFSAKMKYTQLYTADAYAALARAIAAA